MAKTDHTSKAHSGRNPATPACSKTAAHGPSATPALTHDPAFLETLEGALEEIIDGERHRLMRAEALLHCALVAIDENDGRYIRGPYYVTPIECARDLLNQSINQLESVELGPVMERMQSDADIDYVEEIGAHRKKKHEVKECAPPEYVH